jgi:hypothetical protein
MDARVKPGHDAEFFARAILPPIQFSNSQVSIKQASSPVFLAAPGTASSLFSPSRKSRGDGAPSGASIPYVRAPLPVRSASRRSITAFISARGRAFELA